MIVLFQGDFRMIRILMVSVLLVTIGVGSAEAYCRANTIECKEIRLSEKEAELQKKLAASSTDYTKTELQEEIEAIRFEASRLEEKTHKTAINK